MLSSCESHPRPRAQPRHSRYPSSHLQAASCLISSLLSCSPSPCWTRPMHPPIPSCVALRQSCVSGARFLIFGFPGSCIAPGSPLKAHGPCSTVHCGSRGRVLGYMSGGSRPVRLCWFLQSYQPMSCYMIRRGPNAYHRRLGSTIHRESRPHASRFHPMTPAVLLGGSSSFQSPVDACAYTLVSKSIHKPNSKENILVDFLKYHSKVLQRVKCKDQSFQVSHRLR